MSLVRRQCYLSRVEACLRPCFITIVILDPQPATRILHMMICTWMRLCGECTSLTQALVRIVITGESRVERLSFASIHVMVLRKVGLWKGSKRQAFGAGRSTQHVDLRFACSLDPNRDGTAMISLCAVSPGWRFLASARLPVPTLARVNFMRLTTQSGYITSSQHS